MSGRAEYSRPRSQPVRDRRFGRAAEQFARWFGTPTFIFGQTLLVIVWIALNALAVGLRWDPYPFILLNLAFSTQAAYAAPLILLAQTRQADRDKVAAHSMAQIADRQRQHVEQETGRLRELVQANTALTERVAALTAEIHASACGSLTQVSCPRHTTSLIGGGHSDEPDELVAVPLIRRDTDTAAVG